MTSSILHTIKQQYTANDVFITPLQLTKTHIDMIEGRKNDAWFHPFKNNGSYYNQFLTEHKEWMKILHAFE